jgi:hypothetical protein
MDSFGIASGQVSTPSAMSYGISDDDGVLAKYITPMQQSPIYHRGTPQDLFSELDYSSKKMSSIYEPTSEEEILKQTAVHVNHVSIVIKCNSYFDEYY